MSFPGSSDSKETACDSGDPSSIPGLGRAPGEGNGHPLQYSCLENSIDRGVWQATVHGVIKIQTRLSNTNTIYYAMPILKDIFSFPSFTVSSYLVEGILPLFKSWLECHAEEIRYCFSIILRVRVQALDLVSAKWMVLLLILCLGVDRKSCGMKTKV